MGLLPHVLLSQILLTTESGQNIMYNQDGSWDPVGSTSDLVAESSVYEIPVKKGFALPVEQQRQFDALLAGLQKHEIEEFVEIKNLTKDIDAKKLDLATLEGDERKSLAELIDLKKDKLKASKNKYKASYKMLETLDNIRLGKIKKTEKELNKLDEKAFLLFGIKSDEEIIASSPQSVEVDDVQIEDISSTRSPEPSRILDADVAYPTTFDIDRSDRYETNYSCDIIFDGKDPISGKKKKETNDGVLFTFTQPKLKPYFKEEDFLICKSTISKVGKNYYLNLNIRVKSKDAKRTYGSLKAGDQVRLKLVDGTKILAENIISDNGTLEEYSGHTLFKGHFRLLKEDVKTLEKKLLDTIGILWTSGYEEYEIYNIDYLNHQIACLKK